MRAATQRDWLLPNREPRPVQLEALSRSLFGISGYTPDGPRKKPVWLHELTPGVAPRNSAAPGWLHALEMRLGKTLTALAETEFLRAHYDIERVLVLPPNKFKLDWCIEAEAAGVRLPVIELTSAKVKKGLGRLGPGLAVLNYEALAQDKVPAEVLRWAKGGLVIFDESIMLKNPKSNAGKFGKEARTVAAFTRALSGKPVVQGPQDLWAQLRALGGEDRHTFYSWEHRFCKMGGYLGKQVVGAREDTATELQMVLARCSWFATKLEWLGIGDPDYLIRPVAMTPEQKNAYHKMWEDYVLPLANDAMASADQLITALLKLQQIATGFVRDDDREVHWLVPQDRVPKMLEIRALLDTELPANHKLIVICEARPSLDMLTEQLASYGVAVLRGGMTGAATVAEKSRFNEDPGCRVMVGQTKAIKYGHQLMGTHANPCLTTVFFENTYSLDDRSQCEERNRGQGQLGQTTVIDLSVSKQDERMAAALARKESVAQAIAGGSR